MPKNFKPNMQNNRRVFLIGASAVSPGANNLREFLDVVHKGKSALSSKKSLTNIFLAGEPTFNFENYKSWISARHDLKRFAALNEKSTELVKFTLGTCIDVLKNNPELEQVLKDVDPRVAIFIATGLGDLASSFTASKEFEAGLFRWNAFWADPKHNLACKNHLSGKSIDKHAPEHPQKYPHDSLEYFDALKKWNAFWAVKSQKLKKYLKELSALESLPVTGNEIENAKLHLIRLKLKRRRELSQQYGFPTPPWESVSPQLLWNIANLPPAQISMLLNLHGISLGYSGACASFGAILDQGMNELKSGRSDIAIIGATDITPTNELISAFYAARLAVAGQKTGIPFCDLRGTHISGGSCIWFLATEEIIKKHKLKHMGVEILGTGISSDAEHIITPSKEGPKLAIQRAFDNAQITAKQIDMWDMHATGTPGDWNEFKLIEDFVPDSAYISARKGIFGHGMAVSGGWELTAQLLGCRRIRENTFELPPTGIPKSDLNPQIASLKRKIIYDKSIKAKFSSDSPICGKLSMGVGGISSCVITRLCRV